MSIYQKQGEIPHKPHIVFRQPNGELYHEELLAVMIDPFNPLKNHN